jgi:ABC-type lipoprotein release transport system permease subunit
MLYNVGSLDVATFLFTPLLFVGIAFLASYFPARRATKVHPIEALK